MSQIEKRVFPKHKHRLCNRLTFSSSLFKHKFEAKQKKLRGFDKFIIENHRGAGIYEYENTLKAIRKAKDFGIDHIEIDTWLLLKDNMVPVLHGEKDGYITTFEGKNDLIVNFTYEELKNKVFLENGDYIPTLEEVLDEAKGKLIVNIELKGEDLNLLDRIFEILEKKKMYGEVNFSSFYHPFYARYLDLKERYKVKDDLMFGFLMWKNDEVKSFFENVPKDFWRYKNSINFDVELLLKHKWIRKKIMEFRQKGVMITIYFPFKIKENYPLLNIMTDFGVDRVICNDPLILKKYNDLFE